MKLKTDCHVIFFAYTLACFGLFIIACPESPVDDTGGVNPVDLMPEDNEVTGWVADSTAGECYWRIVEGAQQLFDLMDGPGEPYVQRGFVRGAFRGYNDISNLLGGDTVSTCIEIYDQTTHENALDVFEVVGTPGYNYEIVDCGDTARIDTTLLVTISLEMVSEKYFVRLSVDNQIAPYKAAMLSLASVVVQNITAIKE